MTDIKRVFCGGLIIAGMLMFGNFAFAKNASVVSSPNKREKVLVQLEAHLNHDNKQILAKFNQITYPFEFEKEEVKPVKVDVPKDEPKVKPPEDEPEITPEQILRDTAGRIRPQVIGVLEKEGIVMMSTKKYGFLEQGSTIKVNPQGKPRIIVIEEITRNYFILRLNEATFNQTLIEASSGTISRDPSSENPNSRN